VRARGVGKVVVVPQAVHARRPPHDPAPPPTFSASPAFRRRQVGRRIVPSGGRWRQVGVSSLAGQLKRSVAVRRGAGTRAARAALDEPAVASSGSATLKL